MDVNAVGREVARLLCAEAAGTLVVIGVDGAIDTVARGGDRIAPWEQADLPAAVLVAGVGRPDETAICAQIEHGLRMRLADSCRRQPGEPQAAGSGRPLRRARYGRPPRRYQAKAAPATITS